MGLLTDISLKIFFKYFGCGFSRSKSMFLSKASTSHYKKCGIIFIALCFYLHQLKKRVSDFKNSVAQSGNSNVFALCGVIYIQHFRIKSSFSSEKNTGSGI